MRPSEKTPEQADGPAALDDLRAREGTLEGAIQWGEAEGDEPLLLHVITLRLEPLRGDDGAVGVDDPKLTLHSLRLGVSSWRQLEGSRHGLGNVVREIAADGGEHPVYDAYGTLKLGDTYHEVVPALLRFGAREGCTLALRLEARLNPTDRPPSFAATDFAIDADVVLRAVSVVGDSGGDDLPSPDESSALARRLLELDDYEPPVVVDGGCTVLQPRCDGGA
jgi:hypothetical protein